MKFAVIVFPGSNCDQDAYHAAATSLGQSAEYIWHKDTDLKGADVVILPGGFAHGDYLRTGAMARFSPIMREVRGLRAARRSGSRHLQRVPDPPRSGAPAGGDAAQSGPEVPLRARPHPRRTDRYAVHGAVPSGSGAADSDRARRGQLLRGAGRDRRGSKPTARSCSATPRRPAQLDDEANPNGSAAAIAGLCNEARNVVGLMPHPERACEPMLGSGDGMVMFESVVHSLKSGALVARA